MQVKSNVRSDVVNDTILIDLWVDAVDSIELNDLEIDVNRAVPRSVVQVYEEVEHAGPI